MAAAPTQAPPGAQGVNQVPPQQQVIPNAGVYGAETAAALNAYNNAVAQAAAQRNTLYNQYGLTNSGSADINNPEGQYQQMLGAQGQQFQADQADAASRGLRGPGLANQQLSADRNQAQAQDFGFQQQVAQVSADYNQQMQDALNTQQGADAQAYQDAMNTALQNQLAALQAGQYTAPGVGNPAPTTPSPKPPKGGKGGKGGHGRHNPPPRRVRHPRRGGGGGRPARAS